MSIVYSYWIVSFIRNGAEIYIRTVGVVVTRAIQILVRNAINFCIYRTATNGNVTAKASIAHVAKAAANASATRRTGIYRTATNGNIATRAGAISGIATANAGTVIRTGIYRTITNGNVTTRAADHFRARAKTTANAGAARRTGIYRTTTNGNVTARAIYATANASPASIRSRILGS